MRYNDAYLLVSSCKHSTISGVKNKFKKKSSLASSGISTVIPGVAINGGWGHKLTSPSFQSVQSNSSTSLVIAV